MTDRKIDLAEPGSILFFGTMNVMPMMYAERLRELEQDVRYFVDVPESDTLSRPESHHPELVPYPDWIVEFVIRWQILVSLAPRLFLRLMLRRARRKSALGRVKAVFLSGYFINFAPLFPRDTVKIFLSYGGDLDSWCNPDQAESMFEGMRNQSMFRFFPGPIAFRLLRFILRRNYASARAADFVLYFPRGINSAGDKLIDSLQAAGVSYIPRYDISFESLRGADRGFKAPGRKLVILSPVRFLYRTFNDGNPEYSKGNDLIIRGIGLYKAANPDIEVHFFEKGEDVGHAKALCDEVGISDVVTWHAPMPFKDLVRLYERADVCFDQMGNHLVGAVGVIALYMGKPLIANDRNLSFLGETPILSATTPQDVFAHLKTLEDESFRSSISDRSKAFAESSFSPDAVIKRLIGQA